MTPATVSPSTQVIHWSSGLPRSRPFAVSGRLTNDSDCSPPPTTSQRYQRALVPGLLRGPEPGPGEHRLHDQLVAAEERLEALVARVVDVGAEVGVVDVVTDCEPTREGADGERSAVCSAQSTTAEALSAG